MQKGQEADVISLRTPFAERMTFQRFLAEQRAMRLDRQKKQKPEVPLEIVFATLAPFFALGDEHLWDIYDMERRGALERDLKQALSRPYEGRPPRTIVRSLSDSANWTRIYDRPDPTFLFPLCVDDMAYLGDTELERALEKAMAPLMEIVNQGIAEHMPILDARDDAMATALTNLFNEIHAWTMAILYATAFAAIVDHHDAYVQFATLAKIQQHAFIVDIDPYGFKRHAEFYLR